MVTFSQLVDSLVLELRRPDLVRDVAAYMNQTIREVHSDPLTESLPKLFSASRVEASLTVGSVLPLVWENPNPRVFAGGMTARYDSVIEENTHKPCWPIYLTPGPAMNDHEYFFYRAGDSFVFHGAGQEGSQVSISYYEYPPAFKYYMAEKRPATYDSDSDWTYAAEYDVSDEKRLEAQRKTTHWLLNRWTDVISEGVRAKVYKRLSDTERARTCYSLYQQLRVQLVAAESARQGHYA